MSLYDENAAILLQLEADGADLRSARILDFSHLFPDSISAQEFARWAEMAGFSTLIEAVEREGYRFDVTASKSMEPSCRNITDAEERLSNLAQSCAGQADGWGFWRS